MAGEDISDSDDFTCFFGVSMPAIVDVDGDGQLEAIVFADSSGSRPFALHALQLDGTELPGFPRPTTGFLAGHTSAPTVADVDGDGLLEIAYLGVDARNPKGFPRASLHILDLSAKSDALSGWPMIQHDAARTGYFY